MTLHIDILPSAQLKLWLKLQMIPDNFILYGGTAVALQLGHRESVDFDFFSDDPLNKELLLTEFPILMTCTLVQPEINTLNCIINDPDGPVKLQFLTDLGERQKRVKQPIISEDNNIKIASLEDLFATKLNTIQQCAESKDYIDIDAMIHSGLDLAYGLGCAKAVYGKHFDPATSLRALCSFRDGDLSELSDEIKKYLTTCVSLVEDIPEVAAIN